jgi:predicted alpha/beta superfamily hydrolase
MKRITLILLICSCSSFFAFAQVKQESPIQIGTSVIYHSEILDEDRTVLIHNPNEYVDSTESQNYPVIYVLDGHDHFRYLVGLLHRMGNDFLPKMIVVGVTQNDRNKDLRPEGYSNFHSYLTSEIIPFIDSSFQTNGNNMLIGHSLGGLFALTTFIEKNSSFDKYIAIDPYIVEQELPERYRLAHEKGIINNGALYLSIARTFPDSIDLSQLKNDTSKTTSMARETFRFVDEIQKDSLNFEYMYFDNEYHMSVPNISMYQGLRFLYQGYIPEED